MEILFWTSALTVAYVYVGYPLVLAAWQRVARRPIHAERPGGNSLPSVSVIVAARNEGRRLPARIDNLFAQDYPAHLVQIIVVSDGSEDDTTGRLAPYGRRVRLIEQPPLGKASALNRGAAAATGEVLVFADARQRFQADALRHLVTPLLDERVGAVSGELVLDAEVSDAEGPASASSAAEGVGLYWRYEKWLRRHESEVGSTLGVTGAIWAVRRRLWQPLPPETLLDDVLAPMRVVLAGHRVVFAPDARAFDAVSADVGAEQRRKVRTLAGNYQLLVLEPRLLLPVVNPVWLPFVSHKLGRLLVPYALVALLISSAALASQHIFYGLALVGQTAFYVLALHGAALESDKATSVPAASRAELRASRKELVNAQVD